MPRELGTPERGPRRCSGRCWRLLDCLEILQGALNKRKEGAKQATHVQLGQRRSWRACEWRNVAKAMDGGVEGRWSAGRTTEMSGGDAHRREGGIETDDGHVSGVGLVGEMGPIIHDWGVATAHPHSARSRRVG
jgi:hypothetical protein